MSGGEVLGTETHAWAREALGVSVNEIYGQTEANYVIGNCAGALADPAGVDGSRLSGA